MFHSLFWRGILSNIDRDKPSTPERLPTENVGLHTSIVISPTRTSLRQHCVPFNATCRRLFVPLIVVGKHGRNILGRAVVATAGTVSWWQERIQLLRGQQLNDFTRHAAAAGIVIGWSMVTATVETTTIIVIVVARIHTSHRRASIIVHLHVSHGRPVTLQKTAASLGDQSSGGIRFLKGPATKVGAAFGGVQQAGDVGIGL